jgi:hypothetical protein
MVLTTAFTTKYFPSSATISTSKTLHAKKRFHAGRRRFEERRTTWRILRPIITFYVLCGLKTFPSESGRGGRDWEASRPHLPSLIPWHIYCPWSDSIASPHGRLDSRGGARPASPPKTDVVSRHIGNGLGLSLQNWGPGLGNGGFHFREFPIAHLLGQGCKQLWDHILRVLIGWHAVCELSRCVHLFYCWYKLPIMFAETHITVHRLAKSPFSPSRSSGRWPSGSGPN